jgi:parallel beta-helix repeat protein
MRAIVFSFGFASLLVAVPAAAVDRLVDDNLVPCVSGPLPVHGTIGDAVAAAAPGDTIVVCAGTYTEHVSVAQDNVTLRGQGHVKVVGPGSSGHGFRVTGADVVIQGLDVSGFRFGCGIATFAESGIAAGGADIRDNHLHDNAIGICVSFRERFRVRANVTEANSVGIALFGTRNGEVSGNITRNNVHGVSLNECETPFVHHNLALANGIGILVNQCAARVSNNTVRRNTASGINVVGGAAGVITRNLVQSSPVGILLQDVSGVCELSLNGVGFNDIGIELERSHGCIVGRNNVTRSTTVDCRWDGTGTPEFRDNTCGTEIPLGAWD